MDNKAIIVNDISKHFKIYSDRGHTLKDVSIFKSRRENKKKEVLSNISFSVDKGEAVGLIGVNGCGKSTMLKMLAKIMTPDKGSIEINGRVSSLIELGAGFHPDMTGRENIYINASIFGLTKKEIDSRLQEIIDFSEISEYIDTPVRTYSSGMYMRLAFSVAINVDADVLLIDEILAVGDLAFQEKCYRKLENIKKSGTTIVIVSHSMGQIERICDRSIWIEKGKIRMEGPCILVHEKYINEINGGRINNINMPENNLIAEFGDCSVECGTWAGGSDLEAKIIFKKPFVEVPHIYITVQGPASSFASFGYPTEKGFTIRRSISTNNINWMAIGKR